MSFNKKMLFQIEPTREINSRNLIYVKEDFSFDMDPIILDVNFTILLNYLHLSIDEFNNVCQIWGFCPDGAWVSTNKNVPDNYYGKLKVILNSEQEISCAENSVDFAINQDNWPIFINKSSNSICIGNQDAKSSAVQFIKNCVAVINNQGQFEALWLTPQIMESVGKNGIVKY